MIATSMFQGQPPPIPFTLLAYLQLPTSEYQQSPNFLAWLTVNIQLFQDILACAMGLDAALDLGQAIGAQLDVLGSILGQSRTVSFQPSDSVSPVLDDPTFRLLLQATVLRNHWDGKLSSLRTIWNQLFPSGVLLVTDNQNMSCAFYIAAAFTSIIQDLISNNLILPRPQGVLYTFSFAALPLLGFDESTPFIAGFGTLAVSTTGTTTMGSATVTITGSTTGIVNGQTVTGIGIPGDTTITISGSTVTLSNDATLGGTVALHFFTTDTSGHFA
jgi:Protein of unknown function (DUF2612)